MQKNIKPTDTNCTTNNAETDQFVEPDEPKITFPEPNSEAREVFELRKQLEKLQAKIPEYTVGIDLGDLRHRICVNDRLGLITEERAMDNTELAFRALAAQYPRARFVIEVGTHSPWISSLLRELGCEVIVGNARKLKAISEHERKCDELDARTLAKLGRMDIDLLYPIQHINQASLKDRLIISTRENLVKQRKCLVQSVRGSVKPVSSRIAPCCVEVFPGLARKDLADQPDILATIEHTLKVIDSLNESIKQLDAQIEKISLEKYPVTQQLRQVPGVGPITALAFVLAIEDPRRIDRTREVGAYLGLVPGRDQSGDCDPQKGISKTGNPYLRKLLTQCAQYILGAHGPDSDLRQFGLRRAHRCGDTRKSARGAKKKAITAVARKLAVLLLSLWKSGEDYQPFRNAQPVQ